MLRILAFLLASCPALACAQGNSPFFTGSTQPILDCNFAAGASYNAAANTIVAGPLCPGVIFNRASLKYDFNRSGLLTTYAADTPDVPAFDPITGHALGLSIEGTSLILNNRSRDLTQSAWVKARATAALTQTGIDGTANSASLLTAIANNATACELSAGGALQRIVSVYLKPVTLSGEIDVSADNINWTNVTASLTSNHYTRVPPGGLYSTSTAADVCIRVWNSGDAVAVDYANEEYDPNISMVAPTTPVLTTAGSVSRNQDEAWINLMAVPGWNPDKWTIVVREMLPHYVAPTNQQLNRTILQVDDGAGNNAWYLQNEQDSTADSFCNGSAGTILNCPDWAFIPEQGGGSQPSGKVRATVLPSNQLIGLAPPAAGQFSVVAISYDRSLGSALTVNTGGPPTTLGSGVYFPSGKTPVISSAVSPQFASGVFKRLVLGAAPTGYAVIGGTASAGDVLTWNASWENPQTTQQTASVTYTVQAGDTPTSMAAGVVAAIAANSTLNASGISATSTAGTVMPTNSGALFVTWTFSVGGARTETISAAGGYSGSFFGYIQQVQVYNVGLRGADLMQAQLPASPPSTSPTYFLLEGGGRLLLEGGGKLQCEGSC